MWIKLNLLWRKYVLASEQQLSSNTFIFFWCIKLQDKYMKVPISFLFSVVTCLAVNFQSGLEILLDICVFMHKWN